MGAYHESAYDAEMLIENVEEAIMRAKLLDVHKEDRWPQRLDALLKKNLEEFKEQFQRLKNGLIKCRDYIFNFLEDPLIPSDNNASERGIRKLKIKLKNSGTFKSDLGADAFFDLHSIIETAKKHKQTPFEAIRALFGATDSSVVPITE